MASETRINAKPGDWVRFRQMGELRIGVVAYIREMDRYPHTKEAITDVGTVALSEVLEVRTAATEGA
jgi:hypothetical protein